MAATKLDELKCGDCGGGLFRLTHRAHMEDARVGGTMNGHVEGALIATCAECNEESTIDTMPSQLRVEGNLCGGW